MRTILPVPFCYRLEESQVISEPMQSMTYKHRKTEWCSPRASSCQRCLGIRKQYNSLVLLRMRIHTAPQFLLQHGSSAKYATTHDISGHLYVGTDIQDH